MAEIARHASRAAQDGSTTFAPWQEALTTRALAAIGTMLIVLPIGYLVASGNLREGLTFDIPMHIAGGVALLGLWGRRMGSALLRARALLVIGAMCLFLTSVQSGWGAGAVVGFGLWLTLGAVLFGRLAVYVGLPSMLGTTLVYAWLVEKGSLHFETHAFSPSVRSSWYLFGAVFLAGVGIIVFTLRSGARMIATTQERITRLVERQQSEIAALDAIRGATNQAEHRLATAHKAQAITHLTAGLNHRLNNTLMAMRGALQAIRAGDPDTNLNEEVLAITSAARESAQVMQSLMLFSRRHDTPLTVVDVGETLSAFEATLHHGVPRDIDFELRVAPGLEAEVDEHQLRQAVLNLVQNAVDATPSGGQILVRAERRHLEDADADSLGLSAGDFVVVTVADTGFGMSKEVQARAMDPFFSTHTMATHTGMGLTVVYGIARQFRGYLHLQSGDEGTSVHLVIPCYDDTSATASATDLFATLEPSPSHVRTDADDDVNAEEAPPYQKQLLRELARIGTASLVVMGGLALVLHIPMSRILPIPLAMVFVSLPLWGARLRYSIRSSALPLAFLLLGAALVTSSTHQAPAPLALMLIGTGWAALLAPRHMGVFALVLCALTFVVGAEVHAGKEVIPALDMNRGTNWVRVGLVVSTVFAAYAVSVTRILEGARSALADAQARLSALNHTRAQKSQEVRRQRVVERAAQQTERLETTGQLAGTIAHDVNNALQAIMGWADELSVEELSDEEREEAELNLAAAIDYAEALTGQFAEDEAPSSAAPPVIDLSASTHRAAAMLTVMLKGRCHLELDLEEACCAAIHEHDLRRVLFNLVANARDAMPNGGTVTVSLKRTPNDTSPTGNVTLRVSDTGHGMSKEVVARIFAPFYTTKAEGKGTGLGLHTVSHVAKRSAAELDVQTEPGKGSTFSLTLRARSSRFLAPAPKTVTHDFSQGRGIILLAEDDQAVRRIIARALIRAHFIVIEAVDGDEAARVLESRDDISALCIDGVMPGRPSADLISEFLIRWPTRPVILCSGHVPEELERRHLGRDDVAFLAKPFSADKLIAVLTQRLQLSEESRPEQLH